MPISDDLAFPLLRAFGRLECQLKLRSRFLREGSFGVAMVNWRAVDDLVAQLPTDDFVGRVSDVTRRKMLVGARNRPKVQECEEVDGRAKARFRVRNLDRSGQDPSDARALVEATRRVRNNLFHGGKEYPSEQPFDGDDDQWGTAALEVARRLLDLLDHGAFGPADP